MSKAGKTKVSGVLLAAGTSTRFGDNNKLLVEIDGLPLVRLVAERLIASRLAGTVVVTGHDADRVETALSGLRLHIAHNSDFRSGMASSLKCGIAAVDAEAFGAMIVLGDMPGVTTELVDQLLTAFESEGSDSIVFPVDANGRQGNPVIWPQRFFAAMSSLTGDKGAKKLIAENPDAVVEVRMDDDAIFRDIDVPGDLAVDET
ncbi:MAG: nucleotidyltransferase family protein [Pseudomonadota bacterium]